MGRLLRGAIPLLAALFLVPREAGAARQDSLLEIKASAGLTVQAVRPEAGARERLRGHLPLLSLELDDTLLTSEVFASRASGDTVEFSVGASLSGSLRIDGGERRAWSALVTLRNEGTARRKVANVVPLGQAPDRVYITATGPPSLSRSALFRPGVGPVGVILPDNAWEMGFCHVPLAGGGGLAAIARRVGYERAERRRFSTVLDPGGSVTYRLYAETHPGDYREALRRMFQERWLYDLESFDNTLFERQDLAWIRKSYLITLLFAWDREYIDRFADVLGRPGGGFDSILIRHRRLLGPYDVFLIWPTWPRLGLDERNQWDLYRDLPGGVREIRRQAEAGRHSGTRFFIAYNPWDESTRAEPHLKGMEEMLRLVGADGVCLDTWGESSAEFQRAADRVRPGIVMYSEGMAIPRAMPGIVAGRVHDALFLPPPLNLNKLIKPEFAIFRVLQLSEGVLHREVALALFNGYGVELNTMRSGRPDWIEPEYRTLGRVLKILRENSPAFLSRRWEPLVPASVDSVWVNRWPGPAKTLYTIYGVRPEGWNGPLFEARASADSHFVSLWHHEELAPVTRGGRTFIPATVDGFSRAWIGTRREGTVDCIAQFPVILDLRLRGDSLSLSAPRGTSVVVTAGLPAYDARQTKLPPGEHQLSLFALFGAYEGKVVVQLFDGEDLADERVVTVAPATPRLLPGAARTPLARTVPEGMVEIPRGMFPFAVRLPEDANPVVPYPEYPTRTVPMRRFFIDRYPVTNAQFGAFLRATRYRPADTANFLRHWAGGRLPEALASHPVVWVSLEDARAYARWDRKRLPTEMEWQYAAQGTDGRKYPWGDQFDSTRCNFGLNRTTRVGAYPTGGSPFGVEECVGNVWQLTGDVYFNGSYYYGIIRGGSYYHPTSSIWYLKSGPVPVDQTQQLLMVSPGFDRSSTVGFRCVRDAE